MKAKRAQRRHSVERMKARMRFLGTHIWSMAQEWVTEKWVANMVETHGKPCSCLGCSNRRAWHGAPASELRRFHED